MLGVPHAKGFVVSRAVSSSVITSDMACVSKVRSRQPVDGNGRFEPDSSAVGGTSPPRQARVRHSRCQYTGSTCRTEVHLCFENAKLLHSCLKRVAVLELVASHHDHTASRHLRRPAWRVPPCRRPAWRVTPSPSTRGPCNLWQCKAPAAAYLRRARRDGHGSPHAGVRAAGLLEPNTHQRYFSARVSETSWATSARTHFTTQTTRAGRAIMQQIVSCRCTARGRQTRTRERGGVRAVDRRDGVR